jgi:hypothetical protein
MHEGMKWIVDEGKKEKKPKKPKMKKVGVGLGKNSDFQTSGFQTTFRQSLLWKLVSYQFNIVLYLKLKEMRFALAALLLSTAQAVNDPPANPFLAVSCPVCILKNVVWIYLSLLLLFKHRIHTTTHTCLYATLSKPYVLFDLNSFCFLFFRSHLGLFVMAIRTPPTLLLFLARFQNNATNLPSSLSPTIPFSQERILICQFLLSQMSAICGPPVSLQRCCWKIM